MALTLQVGEIKFMVKTG